MTQQQNTPAPADGEYLIRKGGYYYRPNAEGYTPSLEQAGRYTLAEAISYSHPNGPDGPRDGITYELAPNKEPAPADLVEALTATVRDQLASTDYPVSDYEREFVSQILVTMQAYWVSEGGVQADRDLADRLLRPCVKSEIEARALDYIRDGKGDDADAVQLIAAHRMAAAFTPQPDPRDEAIRVLREALQKADE